MSTNLSFNRKLLLQTSLIIALVLLVGNILTSAILGLRLLVPEDIQNQESNAQEDNIQNAIQILKDLGS